MPHVCVFAKSCVRLSLCVCLHVRAYIFCMHVFARERVSEQASTLEAFPSA